MTAGLWLMKGRRGSAHEEPTKEDYRQPTVSYTRRRSRPDPLIPYRSVCVCRPHKVRQYHREHHRDIFLCLCHDSQVGEGSNVVEDAVWKLRDFIPMKRPLK